MNIDIVFFAHVPHYENSGVEWLHDYFGVLNMNKKLHLYPTYLIFIPYLPHLQEPHWTLFLGMRQKLKYQFRVADLGHSFDCNADGIVNYVISVVIENTEKNLTM